MSRFRKALGTSIGRKVVLAATGVALLGFVVAHMAGNLQVFAGPEKLNAYAKSLQDLGPLLWIARIGLLGVFLIHVRVAWQLTQENRAARPVAYAVTAPSTSTYASRTMIWSGLVVLAFVVYHLLHFTFGAVQGANHGLTDAAGRPDVHRMVVLGFRNPVVSASYVVAQVLLGMHIAHGASSLFQTFGCTSPRLDCVRRAAGPLLAAVIVLGNCAMPLAILLGLAGKDVV